MLLISQLNFIILLFTFLMPLCKPEVFGYNCHSCWTELASSDFLTFEQCVECDNFRIYLSHNGFVIGIASENDEAKDLWKDCLRISQLVSLCISNIFTRKELLIFLFPMNRQNLEIIYLERLNPFMRNMKIKDKV